ncbi:MAG TPA: hypothetical protein VLV15_08005, partial [Dongiaceae bacterium]|nr:hypothetical protein [Dongiaceae bacterium]
RAAHRIAPADVERIEVGMLAAGFPIVCEPAEAKRRPASQVELQFSLPFGIAIALVTGDASPDRFTLATLEDPRIGELLPRVVGLPDPQLDARFPRAWPTWVRILRRGRPALEARVEHPLGDPEHFPDTAALRAKFRTLAARTLPADALARLEPVVDGFRTLAEAATLLRTAGASVT